ncbi:MAG: class I SAM-dependent methyltransferase [Candidatus Promineofilum sp.]|nr:class I SAM-dependent methyltransferase [Promineifilum sp.]MBP9656503.1 class I SAM-dependent methyltransferase [Promineifilum sp.]
MRNKEQWQPSKFVRYPNGYRASRDRKMVGIGSRLVADILAQAYEQMLRNHARGVLLDLGCGKVPLYEVYQPLTTDVICIDWANTLHPNQFLDVECDLNEGIELANDSVDTILCTDVLEHIAEPERLWRDMARVLRPGGKILLAVPFFYRVHEAPHDYFRYTEFALKRFVAGAGLTLLSLEPYGGWPEVFADLVGKRLAGIRSVSAIHLSLSQALIRTRWGRNLSAGTARDFPLGYTLVAQKPASML